MNTKTERNVLTEEMVVEEMAVEEMAVAETAENHEMVKMVAAEMEEIDAAEIHEVAETAMAETAMAEIQEMTGIAVAEALDVVKEMVTVSRKTVGTIIRIINVKKKNLAIIIHQKHHVVNAMLLAGGRVKKLNSRPGVLYLAYMLSFFLNI